MGAGSRPRAEWGTLALCVGVFFATRPFATHAWLLPEGLGLSLVCAEAARSLRPARWTFLRDGSSLLVGALVGLILARWCGTSSWHAPLGASIAAVALLASAVPAERLASLLVFLLIPVGVQAAESLPSFTRLTGDVDEVTRAVTPHLTLGGAGPAFSLAYVSGMWLLSGLLAVGCRRRSLGRTVLELALVLGAWAVGWGLSQAWLRAHEGPLTGTVQVTPVLCGLSSIIAVWWIGLASHDRRDRGIELATALAVSVLVVGVAVKGLTEMDGGRAGPPASVAVVRIGLQDWEAPRHGRYGSWSGGMFGLLPRFAEAFGGKVEVIEREDLVAERLSAVRVLVFINLNEELTSAERRVVDSFVHRGGTCLVFADHTDVAGLLRPTNSLLHGKGLTIRFDSAKDLVGWPRSVLSSSWPCLCGIGSYAYFPYGIGGSVEVRPPAVPLLKARHAFSDMGSPYNLPGSFLGNYAVDDGESVGDIVLVGGARDGEGRWVLFGDTTPIQNSVLEHSWCGGVSRLLGGVDIAWCAWNASWLSLPLLLCLGLLLRLPSARVPLLGAATTICLVAPACLPGTRVPSLAPKTRPPVVGFVRHEPRDVSPGKQRWRDDWPLSQSAKRAGCVVIGVDDPRDVLPAADVIVCSLPLARVPGQADLVRWMREGGEIVFTGGPRHAAALDDVLVSAGVRVAPEAYGTLPLVAAEGRALDTPRFASAFGIETESAESTQALFTDAGRVIVARATVGRGHLTVIADEAFFFGDNVEGEGAWNLGNLAFLHRLWTLVLPKAP